MSVLHGRNTPYNVYIIYVQKKSIKILKKCLTAGYECVMIFVPLQEGSFFVPENKL